MVLVSKNGTEIKKRVWDSNIYTEAPQPVIHVDTLYPLGYGDRVQSILFLIYRRKAKKRIPGLKS